VANLFKKIIQWIRSDVSCVYRAEDFGDLADQDDIERAFERSRPKRYECTV